MTSDKNVGKITNEKELGMVAGGAAMVSGDGTKKPLSPNQGGGNGDHLAAAKDHKNYSATDVLPGNGGILRF